VGFWVWRYVEKLLQVFAGIILVDEPMNCSLSELKRKFGIIPFVEAHAEKPARKRALPTLSL